MTTESQSAYRLVTWSDLPDPAGRRGWPWRPENDDDADFQSQYESSAALPPILVVTPSYNQGDFLEETIRSVLLQQYPSLSYRVVDGGSDDQSLEILEKYRPWIDHVIIEPDEGQSDAIVKGIGESDKGWFNWINSDDWLAPGTLWKVAEHQEYDLVAMQIQVLGDGEPYIIANRRLCASTMLLDNDYSFAQPALWFRLDRLHECGGINRNLHYGFDWDLMVRYAASRPKIKYLDQISAFFRVHDQSKTSQETRKEDEANRFHQEQGLIRERLEQTLSPALARDSRIGRRRTLWNQTLVRSLDEPDASPIGKSLELFKGMTQDPRARMTKRSWMSIVRLLSRYVRPKASIGKR